MTRIKTSLLKEIQFINLQNQITGSIVVVVIFVEISAVVVVVVEIFVAVVVVLNFSF